jgi:hypothetical protein
MPINELSEIANALFNIGIPIKDIAKRLDLEFEHVELTGEELNNE